MFKITWDSETGGVLLSSKVTKETLGISPRPVFFEELDLLGLDRLGWTYPREEAPIMWAVNKQYWYRGTLLFEAKGANIYDAPTVVLAPGVEPMTLTAIDVDAMLAKNTDQMFLIESEAIEFIRDTFVAYSKVNRAHDTVRANQEMDFEAMAAKVEKKTKTKMAVIREDCDSFDIMPLDVANEEGKRVLLSTRIDRFIASFSGGKDSQVVLDLCTRAIPPTDFEVIYSDTGYELPPSLDLYKQVQRYYKERFPALKFTTTRNHESVLNYWDKIGTPSDTHRWCCSVMKTAPLYRSLKVEGNKQAKVLAFEGVRAEESTRRSNYDRIGKGVKHATTINARPILKWNTAEIFIYLMKYDLPINPAYRQGITRVGCVVCPFASEWNEHIANVKYHENIAPFVHRLEEYTKRAGVKDVDVFIKEGNWKRRSSGNLLNDRTDIRFSIKNSTFSAIIENSKSDILTWLVPIGKFVYAKKANGYSGSLSYKGSTYPFVIKINANKLHFDLYDCQDPVLIGLVRRALYKTGYCIHCEACEVECPTGALSILPTPQIDQSKCVRCQKCLTFHDKGCIVANSLYQTINSKMKAQSSIDRYKNFGLREEWIDAFFASPEDFWDSDHGLNKNYQVPSLRNWLKDADIIDDKLQLTEVGKLLYDIYQDNPSLVWEIIWINLSYNSFIVKWFTARIGASQPFSSKILEEMLQSEFPVYKDKTVHNAVYQLLRTLRESPIGSELEQYEETDKDKAIRRGFSDLSPEAIAYSLYRYGKEKEISFFRVSELYNPDEENGVANEFGLPKVDLIKKLRSLSSDKNRVLIAELNMGLDHITLREDLDAVKALRILTE